MEIRNIVILYNESEITKENIIQDLREEGYKHNFVFANQFTSLEFFETYRMDIDEIWVFGDCKDMWQYQYCVDEGMDLWQML